MPCPKCILGYCLSHPEAKFALQGWIKCITCAYTMKMPVPSKHVALPDEDEDVG